MKLSTATETKSLPPLEQQWTHMFTTRTDCTYAKAGHFIGKQEILLVWAHPLDIGYYAQT